MSVPAGVPPTHAPRTSPTELIRAALFHTPSDPFRTEGALHAWMDGGLLIRAGRVAAIGNFADVRAAAPDASVIDWRGSFVLPGLIDAHVHFPQLRIVGRFGASLLDWLDRIALPEESRMADLRYATETARAFVQALLAHGTTTALVYGAHFAPATLALFETAAARGLRLTSGLVLSDRGLRPDLHQSPAGADRDARELIQRIAGHPRLRYAVTPRFALSTSEAMLEVCQSLCREYPGVTIQTHLNEQPQEIEAVRRLFPWAADYLQVYERFALTGPRTVFGHSVWSSDDEIERLASSGAAVAHCPASNAALGSGVFPLRRHVSAGVRCALGTDVGAGIGLGMLKEATLAALVQRITPGGLTLGPAHLLYLATAGGARALGLEHELGDFQPGKAADLVRLEPRRDSALALGVTEAGTPDQVLGMLLTQGGRDEVREVWIEGEQVHAAGAHD